MVPEESLDVRLVVAHGNRDYKKIYDILKDLLHSESYQALANYMYNNKGHSVFFVEAVAYYNDRPRFNIVHNIAMQVETSPNYLAALNANMRAWDNCREVYLRATREYLSSPRNNNLERYKYTCPDLRLIY